MILAKGGRHWIYAYLFAKKDRDNISPDELAEFKRLADAYSRMTVTEASVALVNRDLLEICHDAEVQVQERRPRGNS